MGVKRVEFVILHPGKPLFCFIEFRSFFVECFCLFLRQAGGTGAERERETGTEAGSMLAAEGPDAGLKLKLTSGEIVT